jgi:hypothetical protein
VAVTARLDPDFNLELLGARSSASAEAALRRQFERVRAMSARERVILALELGEATAPHADDRLAR